MHFCIPRHFHILYVFKVKSLWMRIYRERNNISSRFSKQHPHPFLSLGSACPENQGWHSSEAVSRNYNKEGTKYQRCHVFDIVATANLCRPTQKDTGIDNNH